MTIEKLKAMVMKRIEQMEQTPYDVQANVSKVALMEVISMIEGRFGTIGDGDWSKLFDDNGNAVTPTASPGEV